MNALTPDVIKTLIIAIPATYLAVQLLRMLQRGSISSLTAGKDGIKVDMKAVDKRLESTYYLNRVIDEIDDTVLYKLYRVTLDTGRKLQKLVELESGECSPATYMIYTEMRNVLYQALRENDFKTKLALSHRNGYIEEKLVELVEGYNAGMFLLTKEACRAGDKANFPEWTHIEQEIKALLEEWCNLVAQNIILGSEKKIETYTHYREMFVQTKDTYFIQVMDDCIAKNKQYIIGLGGDTK